MALRDVFEQHPERRYIMFGGKGGLGKTTFSAATAYWLAKSGKRVLVFSVDPQASLSDIFQQDIFGKGPVKIMDNLWAQEIDADQRIKAYQDEIRQKILDMYGFEQVPEEIENYIQAASAEPTVAISAAERATAGKRPRAGGSGLISGRKAFQRPMGEGAALLRAVQDVYLCDDVTIA